MALDRPSQVGPEFFVVAGLEPRQVQLLRANQMFHVLDINLDVPGQLAEDEIIWIEDEQPQFLKLASEDLRQPLFLQVRDTRHRDDLDVVLVAGQDLHRVDHRPQRLSTFG